MKRPVFVSKRAARELLAPVNAAEATASEKYAAWDRLSTEKAPTDRDVVAAYAEYRAAKDAAASEIQRMVGRLMYFAGQSI